MSTESELGIQIKTLGTFEVIAEGDLIEESCWPRKKTKTLLKVLLTNPGRPIAIDQLIEVLLPEANLDKATGNIRARVSELRRVLEPSLSRGSESKYIIRIGEGYAFSTSAPHWLDSEVFKAKIAAADPLFDQGRWTDAVEVLELAVPLYRGEYLAEERYEEWALAARQQLQDMFTEASGKLATCYMELGRHRQAIRCCERILQIAPHREEVTRQLMCCLSQTGQRAKAIEAYEACARKLREQLRVEPSAELCALRDRIIAQADRTDGQTFDSHRIAVIPFVSVGLDSANEFLADGMTEELIYTLSKVAGLEVIAQTTVLKYKGVRRSVADIGQELRVGSLLEGSVQLVQDKARIFVQLIRVENEAHTWSEQYDREMQDVLSVQGDISRKVAAALEIELLAKEETAILKQEVSNRQAQIAYLKGRLFLARRTYGAYLKAIEYFRKALSIESSFARAYTGLADTYLFMIGIIPASEGYAKAEEYTRHAIALDPLCAEAIATLGYSAWKGRGDVHEAESKFVRAIELNPNHAQVYEWYAGLLRHTGRFAEACHQSEQALLLDPLSATLILSYAASLHTSGRLVEAIDQYQKALDINSELEEAWWGLWYSLAAAWDWDRAEMVARETVAQHPSNPFAYVNIATCVMCRGRIDEGICEIGKALALGGNPAKASILFHAGACHYFARDYEKAIRFLRQHLERIPASAQAHNMIAKCLIEQECYQEALDELSIAERIFRGADVFWNRHVHMDRGIIHARRGELKKAEEELASVMSGSGSQNRRISIAGILNALGRTDEAIDWLEAAATAREPHVAALLKVPTFDQLRPHPRYQALLRRIGLAD